MSLKAFHLIFITASIALAIGCGAWALKLYFAPEGQPAELLFALGSFAAAVALVLYERYFLKKTKKESYL